jgi:hypothetical protein
MGRFSPSTALILRSAPQERVSKDGPADSGTSWSILRDAPAALLRMRAEGESAATVTAKAA